MSWRPANDDGQTAPSDSSSIYSSPGIEDVVKDSAQAHCLASTEMSEGSFIKQSVTSDSHSWPDALRLQAPLHSQVQWEWCIFNRHMLESTPDVLTRFSQYLLLIAVESILPSNSDMTSVWERSVTDILSWFRSAQYSESKVVATLSNELLRFILHSVSLFRRLLEYSGGAKDELQHRYFSREYSAQENIRIFSSVICDAEGCGYIGKLDTSKVAEALSKSCLFTNITPQDVTNSRTALKGHFAIGFQEQYEGVPEELLCMMSVRQVDEFCDERRALHSYVPNINHRTTDALVFLGFCARLDPEMLAPPVIAWLASDDDALLSLVNCIQQPHNIERLGLTLLALLFHKRIQNGESGHDFTPWLLDFDSLLLGRWVKSDSKVLEHMMHSILRIFATIDRHKELLGFLSRGLRIKAPVLGVLDGFSDCYWMRRSEGATHVVAMKEQWLVFRNLPGTAIEVSSRGFSRREQSKRLQVADGFETSRVLLEICLYDQYFNIDVPSLATSWAGRWILFRSGFWIEALGPRFKRNGVKKFHLMDAPDGMCMLVGSNCPDLVELPITVLEECALGQMLVAEKTGSWGPFFAFIWWHLVRYFTNLVRRVRR